MSFHEHVDQFAGKQVVEFQRGAPLPDPSTTIPVIRVDWDSDDTAQDLLMELLQDPSADQLTGLVVGQWVGEMVDTAPTDVLETLVAASGQLPRLRAIFLGDIVMEENEVSWIHQTDLSPLWQAFPQLEILRIRGSEGLSLGKIEHDQLDTLIIECGGLPTAVLRQLAAARLPALTHLELYLGDPNYGWDGTVDDVRPLLSGEPFPRLKYLGLRDSVIADDLALAACSSPLLERLETLDLSLGTLSDTGARALLECTAIRRLQKLDLHWHFMSEEVAGQLRALPIEVNVDDRQEEQVYGGEAYRFIAVSE